MINRVLFIFFASFIYCNAQQKSNKPVVLLHGVESHAENLVDLQQWLQNTFNRTVYNIELGDGDDYSTDTPIYTQVDEFKQTIENISALSDGFDFIGISQGGLIGRGYVEKYNQNHFHVDNLITLVSPHGGVFHKYATFIDFYTKKMQTKLSISNYWRDPNKMFKYLLHSAFLADANNEKVSKNDLYKENILSLKNFVMVYSPNDEIVKPPESGFFGIYNKSNQLVNLTQTELYKHDWIGLKTLDESNRLYVFSTNCTHVEHRMPVCFPQLYPIFKKFL
jgi:palmitoyl-protein thioesterase